MTIQEVELNQLLVERRIWQMMTEQVPFGPLGPLYLGLWLADPFSNPSAEVSGGGYQRELISWVATGNTWENSNSITWTATSAWGNIDHYVFLDQPTLGNIIFVWIANNTDVIGEGDVLFVDAGDISISYRGTQYPAPSQ